MHAAQREDVERGEDDDQHDVRCKVAVPELSNEKIDISREESIRINSLLRRNRAISSLTTRVHKISRIADISSRHHFLAPISPLHNRAIRRVLVRVEHAGGFEILRAVHWNVTSFRVSPRTNE